MGIKKKAYDNGWHKAKRGIPRPLLEAAALQRSKGADYNAAVGRSSYFPHGLASYSHEIHKKGLRLVNLASTKGKPNHESVRDTAIDLINYACFLVEALDAKEV